MLIKIVGVSLQATGNWQPIRNHLAVVAYYHDIASQSRMIPGSVFQSLYPRQFSKPAGSSLRQCQFTLLGKYEQLILISKKNRKTTVGSPSPLKGSVF